MHRLRLRPSGNQKRAPQVFGSPVEKKPKKFEKRVDKLNNLCYNKTMEEGKTPRPRPSGKRERTPPKVPQATPSGRDVKDSRPRVCRKGMADHPSTATLLRLANGAGRVSDNGHHRQGRASSFPLMRPGNASFFSSLCTKFYYPLG